MVKTKESPLYLQFQAIRIQMFCEAFSMGFENADLRVVAEHSREALKFIKAIVGQSRCTEVATHLTILVAAEAKANNTEMAVKYYDELRSNLEAMKKRDTGRFKVYSMQAICAGMLIKSIPLETKLGYLNEFFENGDSDVSKEYATVQNQYGSMMMRKSVILKDLNRQSEAIEFTEGTVLPFYQRFTQSARDLNISGPDLEPYVDQEL